MPPTDDPVIRLAAAADVPAVVAHWEAFMADQNRYVRLTRRTATNRALMTERFRGLVGHGQLLVLARAGGDGEGLLGYAAVAVNLPAVETFYASAAVTDVYLDPAVRGRGWGRRLLHAALGVIAERGLHAVTITVASGNDAARALYRSAGFRPFTETLLLPLAPELVRFGPRAPED